MRSESINELATALSKAQAEIKPAHKDSPNPFYKSMYADLASVWEACREPLSKNNLSIVQTVKSVDGHSFLKTTLLHSSGQWIESEIPLINPKNDMQGLGSAITYARRFSLAAIVGITQEDDDGNSIMRQQPSQTSVNLNKNNQVHESPKAQSTQRPASILSK